MQPPTITERYPPMDLNRLVEGIRSFETLPPQDQTKFISEVVAAHPVPSMDWGSGWRFRRARMLHGGELASSVKDTIWNEAKPAQLGRANPAGFRVIYLADRVETALAEVHAENGVVLLSEFSVLPNRATRIAPLGEFELIQRTGRGMLANEASETVSSMINACSPHEARALLIADAFLLSTLARADDNYELSSKVALAIFEKLPEIDAIAFPSMRARGGVCLAVKTENFWENWGLVSVRQVEVTHLAMSYYHIGGGNAVEGITGGGNLRWSARTLQGDSVLLLDPPWIPTGPS